MCVQAWDWLGYPMLWSQRRIRGAHKGGISFQMFALHGRGLNLGPCSMMGTKVTPRLRRAPAHTHARARTHRHTHRHTDTHRHTFVYCSILLDCVTGVIPCHVLIYYILV